MDLFYYKAIDTGGRIIKGQLDALNPVDLEVRLGRLGLELVNCKEVKATRLSAGAGIKRKDLITFCLHLEQLLEAGVPMLDALTDLRDTLDHRRFREIISAMIESIQGGKTLSEAMRDFPYVFSAVFVNLIKAGETTGQITQVLRSVIENLKWQDEQAAYTKRLFMYPAFVAVVTLGALVFLMILVVPELLKFVQTMGQELPLHTRVLIFTSNAVVEFWYLFVSVPVLIISFILIAIKRSPKFHVAFDAAVLRIPLFGQIIKKLILTRIASYFALMYAAGITVLECLKVAEEIAGNKAIEEALRSAARHISDGAGLSNSFAATGLFPALVLRMLRVGETTGGLETALQNVSYFYTRDVRESIEHLQTIIQPAMTLVLGVLLGWVALSVVGPIYDLITKIKF